MMNSLYFVFLLVSVQNVFGLRKQKCEFRDDVCLTEAVRQHVYPMFLSGLPGVEPTEPLHMNTTVINLPNILYKLKNPVLSGFRNCEFVKLKLNPVNTTFIKDVFCPSLTLNAIYEVTRGDSSAPVETYKCATTYQNYFLDCQGNFSQRIDGYGTPYVHITDYTVLPELQGEAIHTCKNADATKENNDSYYSSLEDQARPMVMEKFMHEYMEHLKNFLDAVTIEDLHFRYVV
ncbi:unnamed protein product [Chrysodeixis includens]|uniref:Uncharacterized protein n=1 Tax=Chrysodeixis includens TaxID=689277 RepID=A0A9P0BQ02_CHRIL|nr:unnamed protein product [Chrysodeixis includens]